MGFPPTRSAWRAALLRRPQASERAVFSLWLYAESKSDSASPSGRRTDSAASRNQSVDPASMPEILEARGIPVRRKVVSAALEECALWQSENGLDRTTRRRRARSMWASAGRRHSTRRRPLEYMPYGCLRSQGQAPTPWTSIRGGSIFSLKKIPWSPQDSFDNVTPQTQGVVSRNAGCEALSTRDCRPVTNGTSTSVTVAVDIVGPRPSNPQLVPHFYLVE